MSILKGGIEPLQSTTILRGLVMKNGLLLIMLASLILDLALTSPLFCVTKPMQSREETDMLSVILASSILLLLVFSSRSFCIVTNRFVLRTSSTDCPRELMETAAIRGVDPPRSSSFRVEHRHSPFDCQSVMQLVGRSCEDARRRS